MEVLSTGSNSLHASARCGEKVADAVHWLFLMNLSWLLATATAWSPSTTPPCAVHPIAVARQTVTVMLLRDQTGSGRADDFRYDAYGGNDPVGRYNAQPVYGQGHNAGSKTWIHRSSGWTERRAAAEPSAIYGRIVSTKMPPQPPQPAQVPQQWRREPRGAAQLAPRQAIPARYTATGRVAARHMPDDHDFRYGAGQVADQLGPYETWVTGGP